MGGLRTLVTVMVAEDAVAREVVVKVTELVVLAVMGRGRLL